MAGNDEEKVRYHLFISGKLYDDYDKKFRQEIEKKANKCHVAGIARLSSNDKLEIILEGEKGAASKVHVWLLKEPRLAKIARLESETETFLNEFKGFQTA